MRTLIVLPAPPCVEGGAAARCAVGLMRGLRTHGVTVSAVAARYPFTPPAPVPADLDVEVVPVDSPVSPDRLHRVTRWFRPLHDLWSPRVMACIQDRAREVDVVHFDQIEASVHGPCVDAPSVLHIHYRVRDNPWEGTRSARSLQHRAELMLAERRAIARFRWLVANSEFVAGTLRREGAHVTVAPLSVDAAVPAHTVDPGPPRLGIIGTAQWPPTRDALRRLLTHVWPAIHARVPAASLHVAGRGTQALLGNRQVAGVVLAGEVPDAAAFLAGLSALIYPVSRGSGMKVKVLESLAVGVPVITTRAGSEGIAPCEGVLIAEDDRTLVEFAVRLLADEGSRRLKAAAARALFDSHYRPSPATAALVRLYETMCQSRTHSA